MSDGAGEQWQGGPQFGGEDKDRGKPAEQGSLPEYDQPTYRNPQPGRFRPCALTCLVLLVVFLLVGGIGCALAWGPFVRFGIDSDLVDQRDAVRQMELDEDTKVRLVQKIEHFRDVLPEKSMGFMEWVNHSDAIDDLLLDGQLTPEEIILLEKQYPRGNLPLVKRSSRPPGRSWIGFRVCSGLCRDPTLNAMLQSAGPLPPGRRATGQRPRRRRMRRPCPG